MTCVSGSRFAIQRDQDESALMRLHYASPDCPHDVVDCEKCGPGAVFRPPSCWRSAGLTSSCRPDARRSPIDIAHVSRRLRVASAKIQEAFETYSGDLAALLVLRAFRFGANVKPK